MPPFLAFVSPRRSLSARLFWLVVVIIPVVEIAILIPSLGHERQMWLWNRVEAAHLATLALPATGVSAGAQTELLKLSGTNEIHLSAPGRSVWVCAPGEESRPEVRIDLATETLIASIWRAEMLAVGFDGHTSLVSAPSPLDDSVRMEILVSGATLAGHLRLYAARVAVFAAIIALVTGLIVFLALDRWLVRRMRDLSAGIAAFRADPEHADTILPERFVAENGDELDHAARELVVLQRELRAALWRNARLAALGTAVAKISHDLRNVLAPALMIADRLSAVEEPVFRRAARQLLASVERAADLVSRTLDFTREGPPPLIRERVALAAMIEEAAATSPSLAIDNQVDAALTLDLDRTQIFRVLMNLMRNAAEAGASTFRAQIETRATPLVLLLSDDGPGLSEPALANLFRPFSGHGRAGSTGLGLAIARDLIRAHGGDITLRSTSTHGTMFAIALPEGEDAKQVKERVSFL